MTEKNISVGHKAKKAVDLVHALNACWDGVEVFAGEWSVSYSSHCTPGEGIVVFIE
jgi:hypothetical protein